MTRHAPVVTIAASVPTLECARSPPQSKMPQSSRNPLLLPVYLPSLILAFGRGMLIPILPLYARGFDVSYGMVGLVLAAEGIGRLAGDLPAGLLLGRFSRRALMVLGVSVVVISLMPLYWATGIYQVILCRLAAGFGTAMWNISRHAYIAGVTSVGQRGRALATFGGINRIGGFSGPAVGGAIASFLDLRVPFLIYAGMGAVVAVLSSVTIERSDGREDTTASAGLSGHLRGLVDVIRTHRRSLSTAGLGQMFAQMIRAGREIIVPLYAADAIGLAPGAIGVVITVSRFVDMAMFYPAGMIMDRLGRKFAVVPCFFIQGIGMGLIPLTASFTGLLVATCVLGIGNGLGSGSMMTLGADLAPRTAMGSFLGVWRLIGDGGSMGGPLGVGAVADLAGLSVATFATASAGILAALTFALLVPETLNRKTTPP